MREGKLAGFGDFLDLWSEKEVADKMTPTFVTSVIMDANIKGGVGVRREDTMFCFVHEFWKMRRGQRFGYV